MSKSAEVVLWEIANLAKAGFYEMTGGIESNEAKAMKILLAFRDAAVNEAYKKAAKSLMIRATFLDETKRFQIDPDYLRECAEFILDMKSPAPANQMHGCNHGNTCYGDCIQCQNERDPAKELLFSGQCVHHIPIGQPCSACGR